MYNTFDNFLLTNGSETSSPSPTPTQGVYPSSNYYRPLTIAPASSLTAGNPVSLQIDHAALVTGGKSQSSGDDVAIFYDATGNFNGSETELDRQLDSLSSWNSSSTRLWFALQASLTSTDSAHYRVYYGSSIYQAKSGSVTSTAVTTGSEQQN